jgi:putative modified peptide
MSSHDSVDEAAHLERIADVRVTMSLTPREAFNLLLRLSSDDEFRSQVEAQPHRVLAEHGINVPSEDIPLQASLPPKEVLQEVMLQLMAGQQGTIAELPFNVDPMYWWFIDFIIFLVQRREPGGVA